MDAWSSPAPEGAEVEPCLHWVRESLPRDPPHAGPPAGVGNLQCSRLRRAAVPGVGLAERGHGGALNGGRGTTDVDTGAVAS